MKTKEDLCHSDLPNNTFDRAAGSHALAAAGQREPEDLMAMHTSAVDN